MVVFITTLLMVVFIPLNALEGFDCGHQYKEYKTFDASHVEKCPDFEDWFPIIEPKHVQILRSTRIDEIEVRECRILVTQIADYCGSTNSEGVGVSIEVKTNSWTKMLPQDCKKLDDEEIMTYRFGDDKNITWDTHGKGRFSREILERGDSDEHGNCIGEDFTIGNHHFNNHVLRTIVFGQVIKHKVRFNANYQQVEINGERIPVKERYSYQRSTIIWDDPEKTCSTNIFELYKGAAQLYKSDDPTISSMLLVEDFADQSIFGLEIKDQVHICKHEVYKTNIQDVYITMNETFLNSGLYWEITEVTEAGSQVDEVQNLKALLTKNFVTYGVAFSEALKAMFISICENLREITMANLLLMRISEDEGLVASFGQGYNAVRRGAGFHVYPCRKVEVTYRHILNDTRDVPIYFEDSLGRQREGYLDIVTGKIKNTTIFYETSETLPVGWDFGGGSFKCKSGTLSECESPAMLPVDFGVVKEALDQKQQTIAVDGHLDSTKIQNNEDNKKDNLEKVQLQMIADRENDIKIQQKKQGLQIQRKDYQHVFETFGMPGFQEEVTHIRENTGFIHSIILGMGVGSVVSFIIFAFAKGFFLYMDPTVNFTHKNLFYAIFKPDKIYGEQERLLALKNENRFQELKLKIKQNGYQEIV